MIVVSIVALLLMLPLLYFMYRADKPSGMLDDGERTIKVYYSVYHYLGWMVPMFALIALVGFPFGCSLYIFLLMQAKVDNASLKHALMGISAMAFLGVMSYLLTLRYPSGLLQAYVDMPWWLGG